MEKNPEGLTPEKQFNLEGLRDSKRPTGDPPEHSIIEILRQRLMGVASLGGLGIFALWSFAPVLWLQLPCTLEGPAECPVLGSVTRLLTTPALL